MSKMSFAANVSPASGPGETRHTNVFVPPLRLSIFTVMPPAIGGYIVRCRVTFDPGRRRHAISSSGIEANSIPRVGFIVTNMSVQARGVVHFYNGRGTAEQWIKEGKYALNWTRLSCQRFVSSQVRLALFVLAYNLGNFLRRLVLPGRIKHWSLRTLLTKLIKIGAKVVRRSRIVTFQMAEVAVSKETWAEILSRIDRLRWRTA